jgi:hypothetical protein
VFQAVTQRTVKAWARWNRYICTLFLDGSMYTLLIDDAVVGDSHGWPARGGGLIEASPGRREAPGRRSPNDV